MSDTIEITRNISPEELAEDASHDATRLDTVEQVEYYDHDDTETDEETEAARPVRKATIELTADETFIPESVDQLLAHSRRYPLLTPDQEIELAQRIERGDLRAQGMVMNPNLRLVAS